mmetsp:Transcript_23826/g.69933  ORF Transcript_23826/g.69933 Transcript_23826/m.69933 type:complete len:240 (-) Transcript_23826:2071-2790(-)
MRRPLQPVPAVPFLDDRVEERAKLVVALGVARDASDGVVRQPHARPNHVVQRDAARGARVLELLVQLTRQVLGHQRDVHSPVRRQLERRVPALVVAPLLRAGVRCRAVARALGAVVQRVRRKRLLPQLGELADVHPPHRLERRQRETLALRGRLEDGGVVEVAQQLHAHLRVERGEPRGVVHRDAVHRRRERGGLRLLSLGLDAARREVELLDDALSIRERVAQHHQPRERVAVGGVVR